MWPEHLKDCCKCSYAKAENKENKFFLRYRRHTAASLVLNHAAWIKF